VAINRMKRIIIENIVFLRFIGFSLEKYDDARIDFAA
jgi:hypothetical protein